jgi:hypothetical protein
VAGEVEHKRVPGGRSCSLVPATAWPQGCWILLASCRGPAVHLPAITNMKSTENKYKVRIRC